MTGSNVETAHRSWRRRHYVVDARYQLRAGILVGLVTLALLALLNASLFMRDRHGQATPNLPHTDGTSWALLLVGSGVFLLGVLAVGVMESHRTAGAAFAIRRTVDQLRLGDRGARVRLRRGDHLQELARAVNELAESLEKGR